MPSTMTGPHHLMCERRIGWPIAGPPSGAAGTTAAQPFTGAAGRTVAQRTRPTAHPAAHSPLAAHPPNRPIGLVRLPDPAVVTKDQERIEGPGKRSIMRHSD